MTNIQELALMPFTRTIVLLVVACAVSLAQYTPKIPSTAPTDADLFVASYRAVSTLASSIDDSQTTLTVGSGHGALFAINNLIVCESEIMLVTAISTDTLTVTRAQQGTTAASHASGLQIYNLTHPAYHNNIAAEIKAMGQWLVDHWDEGTGTFTAAHVEATGPGPAETTEEAAPGGSPPSGTLYQWADSTNKGAWAKDSSGNTYRDVRAGQSPCNSTTGKLIGINADGTYNCGTDQTGSAAIVRQYGGRLIPSTDPTAYFTVPQACTIIAWNILVDAGTATVKFWKVASGTAIPTSLNSINTSGVAISTGTAVRSTTLSDFTTTSVSANDIGAVTITTSTGAAWVQATVECEQ